MKKVLTILLVILFVLAASVLWIWRSMGVTDAAMLVPAETVALASLPDLPRSAIRWPQTTLSKIGLEPEMKSFLEKPVQYLSKNRGGDEAGGILWNLKPGRIFTAVVSVSAQEAAVVVGFQYWGGKSAYDDAVARLRQELTAGDRAAELTRENYGTAEIISSVHQGVTLFTATEGRWGFLSNNQAAIKDAIERAAGVSSTPSLADNPRYQQVRGRLAKDPDFLVFCQPQSALETLLAVGQTMGAQAIPQQVAQAKKVEAIGATTKLDGANLRDTIFILRANPPDVGSLTHRAMKLTSEATTAYFDFVADFQQISGAAANPALASLARIPALQNSRLFPLIPEAFGPECALAMSWPAERMKPEGIFAVQIRDQAKADEAMQELLALFPEASVTTEGQARAYSFPALQSAFANPTVAITDGFLIVGVDPGDLGRALTAMQSGASLEKSPAFAPALPAFQSANETFGYIDSKALFERGFPMLRQVIIFGAAFMPGANEIIDSSKIPQTESIAKHLQPIVYAQTRLPEGYLIESSGPITMNHVLLLGASAGASFLRPENGIR